MYDSSDHDDDAVSICTLKMPCVLKVNALCDCLLFRVLYSLLCGLLVHSRSSVYVFSCSVLDSVDSQFALLTAALDKRRKELRMKVLERTQVRVHALMTQAALVCMCWCSA